MQAAFSIADKNGDGLVDLDEFTSYVLGGMVTPGSKKPAAGSPCALIRQKGSQKFLRVPEAPPMAKSDGFQRRPRSASSSATKKWCSSIPHVRHGKSSSTGRTAAR